MKQKLLTMMSKVKKKLSNFIILTKEIILENKSDIFNIKLLLGINKNTNAQTNNPINVYINIITFTRSFFNKYNNKETIF